MRVLLPPVEAGSDPLAMYADAPRPTHADRPWLLANMVAGLDGSAAFRGRTRELSSATDRSLFMFLRSLADVVLVGAGTVRREHYGPARLTDQQREARGARGQEPLPPIAVVSRSLDLPWASSLFSTPDAPRPIVVTATAAGQPGIDRARAHAEVIVAGDSVVDLAVALRELRRRGAATVLTEGGPSLLGEAMDGGLVDELCLTLSPVAGGDPLPIVQRASGDQGLIPFRLAGLAEEDGQLFLRYLSRRP